MAEDNSCTLDQWLTSAMAAMLFAARHWAQFCKETSAIIGEPVEIDAETMRHHANHLSDLVDSERMPS